MLGPGSLKVHFGKLAKCVFWPGTLVPGFEKDECFLVQKETGAMLLAREGAQFNAEAQGLSASTSEHSVLLTLCHSCFHDVQRRPFQDRFRHQSFIPCK